MPGAPRWTALEGTSRLQAFQEAAHARTARAWLDAMRSYQSPPQNMLVALDAGSGYHFREREGSLLVMGPGDPHEWAHHREWLQRRLPRAAVERPEAHWTGYYEVTFDHHPLVGQTERPGVWAMCGFSGHGVMHSPSTADCLAAMILGDSPPIDVSALSPGRTEALVDPTQL